MTCGLVYRQFADVAALRNGTDELAAKLAGFAPISMRTTNRCCSLRTALGPDQIRQRDAALLAYLVTTADAQQMP